MSSEMQVTSNSNESIDWIEESISKKRIKHYEYEHFNNIQELGFEGFGKIFRANLKKSDKSLSLKSFKNFDNLVAKELVRELKLHRNSEFFNNIIRFYGITTKENENDKAKEYLLVMEYADSGNLQNYLKNNFNRLTWDNKFELAYQLASAVLYLHDEGIMHLDLHSKSISIHQNNIKLNDFGLTKRIEEVSKNQSKFYHVPYIDPKRLINKKYNLNEKSDAYSVGVILWEISSGRPPFGKTYDIFSLTYKISQGARENPIPDTPDSYVKIYTECWNQEPDDRPTMNEVFDRLKSARKLKNKQINKLEREPNAECSNIPSNDINRFITNGITMFSGIINEVVHKNQERELDDVTYRNVYNNAESEQTYDNLYQHDSNSSHLLDTLNEIDIGTRSNREKAVKICKRAESLFHEVGGAFETDDHQKKVMGLLKKSAEGAVVMAGMLQNGHNDENMVEAVESFKKKVVHNDECCIS
ncbi:hypothetical protein RclHR1_00590027 [Rhizophagus clarus]|uniref:Kinase-like domain-containing protein n=1 Tax=Rhizophagus clarus TaxID=94130 RepID=A0A2Z6RRB4_9GLOM|nr:hypothetical protein RclHR1_00590027 [Rhizophagus clarus]GES92486.1 kinase-like domain-containing protein [Rhizophagus clarus]